MSESKRGSKKGSLFYKCPRCDNEFRSVSKKKSIACPNCGVSIGLRYARIYYFSQNQFMKELAKGPIVHSSTDYGSEVRKHVEKLKPPSRSSGSFKRRENPQNREVITYMVGDERRAVDKFIEENEKMVRENLKDRTNLFASQWSEYLYQILLEQWYIGHSEEVNDG